jgi:chemotaxis family two-component system response regulator PixH
MSTALVVEDSLTDREMFAVYLNKSGFEVITAESAEAAQEKISNCQPDIIILDVILPGRSGFEICREFKTNPKTNKIPIIFCSNKGTKVDKFWGLKQGAAAYLTKPIEWEELVSIIKQLVLS